MQNNNKKEYEDRQIAVHKAGKSLLELQDSLKIDDESKRVHGDKSLVKLVMVDYSKEQHTQVYCNVNPSVISYIKEVSLQCRPNFQYTKSKIFGDPDSNGESIVTKLTINRTATDKNGAKRNYPWYVCIENGKGRKAKAQSGGTYIAANSYKCEKRVQINMTDVEMYSLMRKGERYIENFEDKVISTRTLQSFGSSLCSWIKSLFKPQE